MLFLALALSYFCGAIPFGVLIGKARGVDVRAVGSGNIGATNVWRTLGPVAGTTAFILDVAKGLAGPFIGRMLIPSAGNEVSIALCGIMAVLGHVFSPFLNFKGGKGIATSLGALLGLMPFIALLAFAFWGVVLGLTRMISAASIAACIALPILALLFRAPLPYFIVGLLMSIVAFLKHIPNMKRIAAGVEPKVGTKKTA